MDVNRPLHALVACAAGPGVGPVCGVSVDCPELGAGSMGILGTTSITV